MDSKPSARRGRGVLALSSYEQCPRPGPATVGSWHQIRCHRPNHNPAIGRGKEIGSQHTNNSPVECRKVANGQDVNKSSVCREINGNHNGHSSEISNKSDMKNSDIRMNMSNGNSQEINRHTSQNQSASTETHTPVINVKEGDLLAKYNYKANPDRPGGFDELSIKQGEKLKLICKGHAETKNHLWWEVENERGETGFVPANYCMVLEKAPTALPWLENKRLIEEQEQKKMESLAASNKSEDKEYLEIFGAPIRSTPMVKAYQSAYTNNNTPPPKNKAEASKEFYCEVCDKNLNGPQPYKMHMSSKAHREEIEYQESKKHYN